MDEDVSKAFDRIYDKVDELSIQVAKLEQHKENGHVKKTESFGLWKIIISGVALGILVLQIMGMIK